MLHLICLSLLLGYAPHRDDTTPLTLGAGQPWYDQQSATAKTFEGILDYTPATGRIGIPAGFQPFRLIRRVEDTHQILSQPVHAPGHEAMLAQQVGQRVKVEAKAVERGDGAAKTTELWLGKLTPLGAAPPNAYSEIKPLARTNRFTPGLTRSSNELSTHVLRSGAEVAKTLGLNGPGADREATNGLATMLGVKTIDWKKEMVVHVSMLYTRGNIALTNKLEVTRLEVNDRGVTVHWKLEQQRGGRGNPIALTDTVLVPRIDGEVTFKKEAGEEEAAPGKKEETGPPQPLPTKPVVPKKR